MISLSLPVSISFSPSFSLSLSLSLSLPPSPSWYASPFYLIIPLLYPLTSRHCLTMSCRPSRSGTPRILEGKAPREAQTASDLATAGGSLGAMLTFIS